MTTCSSRRRFLKGTLKGMAVIGSSIYVLPIVAGSKTSQPITLLFSEGIRNTQFAYGVTQVANIEAKALAMFKPQEWQQTIQQYAGQRLIGLMDNASFAIFETTLANQNAHFLITGHHAKGHRFVTVPESAGVAAALDNHLAVNPEGYLLEEICCGRPNHATERQPVNVQSRGRDWAFTIGAYYAEIANGKWAAGQAGNFSRQGATMASAEDALVSFVVEV